MKKCGRGLDNTARSREGSIFKPEVLQVGLFTQLCHQIGLRAVNDRKRSKEQTSQWCSSSRKLVILFVFIAVAVIVL